MACAEKYGEFDNFMQKFNPAMQEIYCNGNNLERCFTGSAPSLVTLNNAYGDKSSTKWLYVQILDVLNFTGCRDRMTEAQIAETARVIANRYHMMKVTELMYFFLLFKAGEYGRFFGAMDPMVITSALNEFYKGKREQMLERYMKDQQRKENEERHAEMMTARCTREEAVKLESYKQAVERNIAWSERIRA